MIPFTFQNGFQRYLVMIGIAVILPFSAIAQVDLEKLDKYIIDKDCEKGRKYIDKNLEELLYTDSLFVDFHKKAINLLSTCGDTRREIDIRKRLFKYYESINSVNAGVQAYSIGNRYYYPVQELDSSIHYIAQASNILKKELGETHSYYTGSLNTLGTAYKAKGEYTRARRTLLEAKKIKERLEKYDKQYARILNNLGDVYTRTYKYEDAEECLDRSAELKKEILGESVDYAKTLYNQVVLGQALGDRENLLKALTEVREAYTIFDKVGNESLVIKSRIIEGQLLMSLDSTKESIDIFNATLDKYYSDAEETDNSSEDLSLIYYSLSIAWKNERDFDKAIQYSEKALEQMARVNGKNHPKYALQLRGHANLLFDVNRTDDLDDLYLESSSIIGKTYGKRNYEYYLSQHAYFVYLVRSGQQEKALDLYEKLGESLEKHIIEVSQYLSIAELAEVTSTYRDYFYALLTLTLLQPDDAELRIRSANATIFYKGYILENILEDRKAIKKSGILIELKEEITEKRVLLDELFKADDLDQDRVDEVKSELADLERSFSRTRGDQSSGYEEITTEDIIYSLLGSEAAIEFIRLKLEKDEDALYVALLFHPNEEEPKLIDLFRESEITDLFENGEVNSDALYEKLYQTKGSTRGLAPAADEKKVSLFTMIWEKLIPELEDIDRIYYSADGIIHAMALHAVELAPKEYAGQKYALVQTTSLRNKAKDELPRIYNEKSTAFLVGGVDYGGADVAMVRGGGQSWSDLRYTQIELTNIETVMRGREFDVLAMQGPEPTHDNVLDALKKTPSPRYIHLATHGYFKSENILKVGEELDVSASQLDLSRSGLVLAGANSLPDGRSILSSNEIAELDLENTELVVLSACETGLGQIYAQEGVSGLQRAFRIAGTKYMIMSLWPVPDEETEYFMQLFYKYLVDEGKTVEDSYYATQREMMALPFSKPKQWAGFILIN